MDIYRTLSRGQYETDFSFLNNNKAFPPAEVIGRNAVYRYNKRLFSGEYGKDKKLIALIDSQETEIPYKVLTLNFFKLMVNKLDSLLFSNELTVKTGDIRRDELVRDLIERTNWETSIRRAVRLSQILGDSCIKTYRNGASAFSPLNCFKIVDKHNKENVKAYVIYEHLFNKDNTKIEALRLEIHKAGKIVELVYSYSGTVIGGNIGSPIDYEFNGRKISKKGNSYDTNCDINCVQWLSVNKECDGVYGQSSFLDIQDIVFALEQRLSSEMWVIDNHEKPFLIVGMSNIVPNEKTGEYNLKQINGKYLISNPGDTEAKYLTWDGQLGNSKAFRDDLMSYFYELSELGKTYLSGEYSGNISEETLNNTIKSAIDRGNRECADIWQEVRNSLYVLCKLNNINIKLEDINISFNIGRSDDDKQVAEIIKTLSSEGIFSKVTLLERYFGYTREQALSELELIKREKE